MKDLGVVVVTFHCAGLLRDLVSRHGWLASVPLVVVENSDDPAELGRVRDAVAGVPDATVLDARGNVGFGAGVNLGMAELARRGCQLALVLNPDARLPYSGLTALLEAAAQRPGALVSPVIDDATGATWFAGGDLDWRSGRARHASGSLDWLTAACLLVPVDRFANVGGFDERFFLYWEDVDLSRRWLDAGGELVVADSARAVHLVGATQPGADASTGKSLVYLRRSCQNRLRFAARHCPPRARLRWLLLSPGYARLMVKRRRAGGVETWRSWRAVAVGTALGAGTLLLGGRDRRPRGRRP